MHYFSADPPPVSPSFAALLTIFFTLSYVGSLYVSQSARLAFVTRQFHTTRNGEAPIRERTKFQGERWRDDPGVIKARLSAATMSTVVSCAVVGWVVGAVAMKDEVYANLDPSGRTPIWRDTLWRLGLLPASSSTATPPPVNPAISVLPHLITPILYLGPLYCTYLARALPFQRNSEFIEGVKATFGTWIGFRNFIVGPLTEEFVWRGCILSICHLSGTSKTTMIFLTPLSFGAAHLHHAWDAYNRYGRTTAALKRAVLMTLFQLTYTTLFGAHCAFLFLRTGYLYPSLTAHIWCNVMGMPQLASELQTFPTRRGPIYVAYVLGIVGFAVTMRLWTVDEESVYWAPPNGFL